jgi:hypothetical protein
MCENFAHLNEEVDMVKTLAIAALATVMVMGLSLSSSIAGAKDPAKDPSAGQSSSELNTLSPRTGSPSESGKTGIGSTSGSDASIDTGLKATTQETMAPCPEKSSAQNAERNKGTGIVEGTLGDQQRKSDQAQSKVDASKQRSSAEMSARMGADPCMEGPATSPQKEPR